MNATPDADTAAAGASSRSALLMASRHAGLLVLGLFLFILALEILKTGARGIAPLIRHLDVEGMAGGLGLGWLMACLFLSGSPVAAIALTLLASGALLVQEAFAMLTGSRLGASFVVLVVGVLDDMRHHRREKKSAYIGVAALVTTAVVYVPAMALGYVALTEGAFAGLRIEGRDLASLIDRLWGPLTRLAVAHVPGWLLFPVGALLLLAGFKAFDALLPDLRGGDSIARVGRVAYRPWFMFALGLGVTALTLSVSVSLSLLVPLAAKGFVRRENVCPYILGANITTFIDTLFAAALVGHPEAVRITALLMGAVTVLSLPVVFLFPYAFQRAVDRAARLASRDTRALLVFLAGLLLVPTLLIAW